MFGDDTVWDMVLEGATQSMEDWPTPRMTDDLVLAVPLYKM